MFDQQQQIYMIDNNGVSYLLGWVNNKDFGNSVVDYCKTLLINNVHLFGVTEYADHYADAIKRAEKKNYSTSNINVEIN